MPDGTTVEEAIIILEGLGLSCEVDGSKLRCRSRTVRYFASEDPVSLELDIEDGKVFDRRLPPHMKPYRTHGGVI